MAEYTNIFALALVINVIVTFLSSGSCKKYMSCLPCFGSFVPVSASEPLSSGNKSDEESPDLDTEPLVLSAENSSKQGDNKKAIHSKLLTRYLCVYLLATCSDWFQGPYVYALYDGYGFSQHDIAVLFVAGFGSSMTFGSFVGGMADSGGRKKYVIVYTMIYALSCLTKHSNQFWMLMIGRLLGGIATSLLFSVFDSWLIKAHAIEGLDQSFISKSFAAAQYGNSIVAISAGLVANYISSMNTLTVYSNEIHPIHTGGYLNPFDAALLALILCGTCASYLWTENYGDKDEGSETQESTPRPGALTIFSNAFSTTVGDSNILLCGIISSLFEGSMYIFVFMWSPFLMALSEKDEKGEVHLPFGVIFSTFMVCCMVGSSIFSILIERMRLEQIGIYVFFVAAIAMAIINLSSSDTVAFIAMNLFEMCVGMYFPIMGTLKSSVVPENQRSAIYNLYRIPLNIIVVTSLLVDPTPRTAFMVTTLMLGTAVVLQTKLSGDRMASDKSSL